MVLKLKSNKENLQDDFERILDVLSVAVNRGLNKSLLSDLQKEEHLQRSNLWMYQKNGSCSDFKNFDRVDLKPTMNDYWLDIQSRSETGITFILRFRYAKSENEDIFSKMLLYLFSHNLELLT